MKVKKIIYNSYVNSFKQGIYNYRKLEYDPYSKETVSRKYFAGGEILRGTKKVTQTREHEKEELREYRAYKKRKNKAT